MPIELCSRTRLHRSHLQETFLQTSQRQVAKDMIKGQQLSKVNFGKFVLNFY